jgi:hypothetical protein
MAQGCAGKIALLQTKRPLPTSDQQLGKIQKQAFSYLYALIQTKSGGYIGRIQINLKKQH